MKVKIINKSHHQLPAYATLQSAGMDLRANLEEPVTLKPLERKLIPTGLFMALPDGYVPSVQSPSGSDASLDNRTFAPVGNLYSGVRCSCISDFRRGQFAYRFVAIQQSAHSGPGISGREVGLELFFQPGIIAAAHRVIRYAVGEVKIQPAIGKRDFLYLEMCAVHSRPYGVEAVDGPDCFNEDFLVDYAPGTYIRKPGQEKPKRNSNLFHRLHRYRACISLSFL